MIIKKNLFMQVLILIAVMTMPLQGMVQVLPASHQEAEHTGKQTIQARIAQATQRAADYAGKVVYDAKKAIKDIVQWARENPVPAAVGMGMGIGIGGFMVTRRAQQGAVNPPTPTNNHAAGAQINQAPPLQPPADIATSSASISFHRTDGPPPFPSQSSGSSASTSSSSSSSSTSSFSSSDLLREQDRL